ncbi:hypothetical protein BU15DRAFT_65069 [Melanogaster broomeanus]|nr:hypothetical protein BU15DRAFT_65069 [Melanogaster broomeanus]
MPILPLPHSSPLVTAMSHHAPMMVMASTGLRRLTAVLVVRSGPDLGTLTMTDDVAMAGSSNHSRGSSPTLVTECAWAACSDETIESLERRVADLQHELQAAQEPRGFPDHGFASFPQWGRGRGEYPSNFPARGLKTVKAMRQGAQAATQGQEVRLLETEARSSASGLTMKEPSSCPKPSKIIQWHTAEWSEDKPNTDDAESDWSPVTTMRSIGNSVVLTINKIEFAFSGEAAKKATVAYQKHHMPPVSLRVRHWGDSASPLMGRSSEGSQVQRYGQMLATASELGKNLSDAQAYGLARWRGLSRHNPVTGPSMGPAQGIVSGHTGPAPGARVPKVPQPTYNDPPSVWTEWLKVYDHHRAGVLVYEDGTHSVHAMWGSMLMSHMQPSVGTSSSRQHFIQQAALLLMLPGQYRAITKRFDISISATCAVGPIRNFGPNSGVIDITRAMAYQGVTWIEADNAFIRQGLQVYEIRVCSAELATWYIEVLPSGMAPALSRVGPALVKAFAVPSGMVVPPGEANSTHTAHIPGPQDQDQDMDGPPVLSEPGMVEPSLAIPPSPWSPLVSYQWRSSLGNFHQHLSWSWLKKGRV